jgi:hypothetical protein
MAVGVLRGRVGRTVAALAATLGIALGASACSVTVAEADLEQNVGTTLRETVPGLGEVSCPGDLPGEVGAKITCETSTPDGQPIGAVITVTSVEGSTVNYTIDTQARPVSRTLLETKVRDLVEPQLGVTVDRLTCDGDLAPQMGAMQACAVAAGGENIPLKVSVTQIDGGLINFSVEAA